MSAMSISFSRFAGLLTRLRRGSELSPCRSSDPVIRSGNTDRSTSIRHEREGVVEGRKLRVSRSGAGKFKAAQSGPRPGAPTQIRSRFEDTRISGQQISVAGW